VAKVSIGIGAVCYFGHQYWAWLETKDVVMPTLAVVYLDGAGVWILMGIILIIVAQILRKGIEIQDGNDLTI
jgi:hypothetical protein